MRILVISLLMLLPALAVQAEPPADAAFERITKADLFAFGGGGFAGQISQGEKDFVTILSRPSAMEDFERVFVAGNLQAKAYALVGIRGLNEDRFRELLRSLRGSQDRVLTARGCIISREPMSTVVRSIEAGSYPASK